MGHFFVILKCMIKSDWEQGVKLLVSSTTSKVIFMSSVTCVDDFIDSVDILRDQITKCRLVNPVLTDKFKQSLMKSPYIIYCFFLELSKNSPDPTTVGT